MDAIPFDIIIDLIKTVVHIAKNVKANRERCQRVAKRACAVQELVIKLRMRDPRHISDVVRNALNELSAVLVNAKNIMIKYNQCGTVKNFVLNSSHEDKFNKINERLDDTIQILTSALQIEQGDILIQVLDAVKNDARPPCPLGFMPMPMPTPTNFPPSTVQNPPLSTPTNPAVIPTVPNPTNSNPVTSSVAVPAITVTPAPNPPYPPAVRPPPNPNILNVPYVQMPVPCAMPPRVVVPVGPNIYGTLPRPAVVNPIIRHAAPTVVYAQAMPPKQIIVAVPPPKVLVGQAVAQTIVVTRPF